VPPLVPAKVLRTDAAVPTKRRSSRASRAAASTAAAASGDSRGAAELSELRPAATTTEPLPVAAEAQQAATIAEPQQLATAVDPQQTASVTAAITAVAVAAPPTSPAPAVAGSLRAAVVETLTTTTSRRQAETSGRARLCQPPSPRRGRSWLGATSARRWGAQRTASGPRRRALDPQRAWSRSGRLPTPRRPTSSRLRRSKGSSRSSATTAPRSTGH
jgi:hypothetical protein